MLAEAFLAKIFKQMTGPEGSSMKRTTRKLSGTGLDRFLKRFFATQEGVDAGLARDLTEATAQAFASVRVKRAAWNTRRRPKKTEATSKTAVTPAKKKGTAATKKAAGAAKPPQATRASTKSSTETFDPYAIGLVPVYQREGADGLRIRLSEILSTDNLRKMARAQQVALPKELRGPDAEIDDIRNAIVTAVGKRIADRRAAAG